MDQRSRCQNLEERGAQRGAGGDSGIRTCHRRRFAGEQLNKLLPKLVAASIQAALVDDDGSARTALACLIKSTGIETVTFSCARDHAGGAHGAAGLLCWNRKARSFDNLSVRAYRCFIVSYSHE